MQRIIRDNLDCMFIESNWWTARWCFWYR